MSKTPEHLGSKLGPRIARLTADAVTHAQVRSGPHKVNLAMALQERFFRLTGSEIQATLGPFFRSVADHELTPDHLARTFSFLADGLGQWQTLLGSQLGGQILGQGLGALITNELEPAVGEILAANPSMILPATIAAQAAARGRADHGTASREAAFNGINGDRFATLVDLARSPLSAGEVIAAWRRGLTDETQARAMLRDGGLRDEATAIALELGHELLPPALLADAVVRGIITQDDAAKVAAQQGFNATDFDVMVRDTGEAPALQTLLEGYRRGLIDDARLAHGIRTGRLRNEWIEFAKQLRYVPPSPAEAIAGAVQGHLPLGEAQHKAEQAGLNPAEFQWLYQTHGEPIATGEALQLWRRGVIGQAEVEQVVRESRVKTKYIPALLELKRHLVPERTIVSAYGKGALTVAEATQRLQWIGVGADDIAWLMREGSATKTAHHRALSEAHVTELYESQAIDHAHASTLLGALGYDQAEADEVLALADMRATRRQQTAVANVIRSRYVARHIDQATASGELDALNYATAERDSLLALWDLERTTTVRLPTVAELTHAVKAQVIDANTWAGRLMDLGYSADDIPIMASAHGVDLSGG